jgi:hypothetical protein
MPIKRSPQLVAWSYSRVTKWEECPAAAKYKFIMKIPEPQSPALARGSAIDDAITAYMRTPRAKLPEAAKLFAKEFAALKKAKPIMQRELAFRRDWTPCGWFDSDCWVRVKWDAGYVRPAVVKIVDFKTGKIREEQKPQLRLYQLSGLLAEPSAPAANADYWYLDQGEIITLPPMERAQLAEEKQYWEARVEPYMRDRLFPPTPSYKCKWCPYRKEAKGPCEF